MAGMVRKQDRNDGRMQRMPFDGCRTGVEAAVAGLVCQLQCLRAAVVLLLRHVPASEHVLWRMNLYGVLCGIVLLLFGRQSGPCDVSGELMCVGMVVTWSLFGTCKCSDVDCSPDPCASGLVFSSSVEAMPVHLSACLCMIAPLCLLLLPYEPKCGS